jgi:hypothetical protein
MNDEIVEQTRKVREELIGRHGGINGYFKYCQAQDRASARTSKLRRKKKKAPVAGPSVSTR